MSATCKVFINKKELEVDPQDTILTAAKKHNVDIPSLCYSPELQHKGACRICLVEVAGAPSLVASCATKITAGMHILTNSKRVLDARRMVVELLVSEGRHDCMICEVSGECLLQKVAYDLSVDICAMRSAEDSTMGYPGAKPKHIVDNSHPLIVWDSGKCILCNRCVLACNSKARQGVLYMNNRGFNSRIVSDNCNLMDSGCVACGECVEACPTGALMERNRSKSSGFHDFAHLDLWKQKQVDTTCPYCGVGCQLTVHMNDEADEVVKVTGRHTEPNQGMLCVKGRFAYDFPQSDKRIIKPMIKKNGQLVEVEWAEALDYTAGRLRSIIDESGPDAFAMTGCARDTNENNYAAMKFARAVIGTNNIDHCARACHAATLAGLTDCIGVGVPTDSMLNIHKADVIFVIGSNTTEAHPVFGYHIKDAIAGGAKLIVNDPRRIDLVASSDIYVPLNVGSDVAYLNGLMHILHRDGTYDKEYVAKNCDNWAQLQAIIEQYPPDEVAEITGVPVDELEEVARVIGAAKTMALIYTLGVTEHATGCDNVRSCANLQLMLGHIGKPGGGIMALQGQNNVQGATDMGALPDYFCGYQRVDDPETVQKFAAAWGAPQLSGQVGNKLPTMLNRMQKKKLRAFFCYGANLVMSEPNVAHTIECLEQLDFLVVADIFYNKTTAMADVLLPTTSWAEVDGTYTNTERRLQRVRPFLKGKHEFKEFWWVAQELGRRLGYDMGFTDSQGIWEE